MYNGITDVYTRIDHLYPTFVLTRANLLEATLRARFQCFLVHASCWSRDQDGSLTASRPLSELIAERVCHFRFDGS